MMMIMNTQSNDKCKSCIWVKKINEYKWYCMFGKCIKRKVSKDEKR